MHKQNINYTAYIPYYLSRHDIAETVLRLTLNTNQSTIYISVCAVIGCMTHGKIISNRTSHNIKILQHRWNSSKSSSNIVKRGEIDTLINHIFVMQANI